jgi:hypothetical protein
MHGSPDGPRNAAPPQPQPQVIVREGLRIRISSFWILALIGAAVAAYFLATDWAAEHHKELHSFSDYTDAIKAALADDEYMKEVMGRIQDFVEQPSCDVPLQWHGTGYTGPCYLTLYEPVRLYPGPDTGIFITVPAASVLKIAAPGPTNADYAYAQTLKLAGAAVPTGATAPDACVTDHRCSALVGGLNKAGLKPASQAPAASAPVSTASVFDGPFFCVKSSSDVPDDHVLQIDSKTKTVREFVRRDHGSCEFTIVDGRNGPVTTAERCNLLPDYMMSAVFYHRVVFSGDTVIWGLFKQSSSGDLTADQLTHTAHLNARTGLFVQPGGEQFQCRVDQSK